MIGYIILLTNWELCMNIEFYNFTYLYSNCLINWVYYILIIYNFFSSNVTLQFKMFFDAFVMGMNSLSDLICRVLYDFFVSSRQYKGEGGLDFRPTLET